MTKFNTYFVLVTHCVAGQPPLLSAHEAARCGAPSALLPETYTLSLLLACSVSLPLCCKMWKVVLSDAAESTCYMRASHIVGSLKHNNRLNSP